VESGKRNDRPKLLEALQLCRLTNAKLVIAKLDRLSRNLHFINSLLEAGVDFVCVDLPQANSLTIQILAAVAEAEAKTISQRTKVALAAAKARGVQLGRPTTAPFTHSQQLQGAAASVAVRQAKSHKFAADVVKVILQLKNNGLSLKDIAMSLNDKGIKTPRGKGQWYASSVCRILNTLRESGNHTTVASW
jgi:DNA invertase Pin-like site-specific DNA recombinase